MCEVPASALFTQIRMFLKLDELAGFIITKPCQGIIIIYY
jgi:hypothetical protein